jgi:Flp pilus assembly pilin Flp
MAALRSLRRDKRGATIVEFALVSPVMILMMMGLGDMGYQVYAQSILNGAMQKAARDSAIQGGANDVTVYTATVTYPHLFPVTGLFGWPSTQTITASTLLKNQPYASQTTVTPATVCT